MSRAQPQTRDAEATQAQILEAAAEIFSRKGFGGSSVSEIADAAGVTKSLIHHHFASKKGLWGAIKERHFRDYFEVQMKMLGSPASAELLERSVETYFRFLGDRPAFVRMLSWILLEETGEQEFSLGEVLTREAVRKIRDTQEAGELRADVHPFSILMAFLSLVEHWFQGKRVHCRGLPADDAIRGDENYLADLSKIFFEGVLPRERSA